MMKKILLPLLIAMFLLSFCNSSYAELKGKDTISITYTFEKPTITKHGEYDHIEIEGLINMGDIGTPSLSTKGAKVLIPFGKEIKSFNVRLGDKITLPGRYFIEPVQKAILSDFKGKIEPTLPNEEIYNLKTPFPPKRAKKLFKSEENPAWQQHCFFLDKRRAIGRIYHS